ncbi:MAG: hypothetical protein ACI8QU_000790, partial [Devosia litorisediminis]
MNWSVVGLTRSATNRLSKAIAAPMKVTCFAQFNATTSRPERTKISIQMQRPLALTDA